MPRREVSTLESRQKVDHKVIVPTRARRAVGCLATGGGREGEGQSWCWTTICRTRSHLTVDAIRFVTSIPCAIYRSVAYRIEPAEIEPPSERAIAANGRQQQQRRAARPASRSTGAQDLPPSPCNGGGAAEAGRRRPSTWKAPVAGTHRPKSLNSGLPTRASSTDEILRRAKLSPNHHRQPPRGTPADVTGPGQWSSTPLPRIKRAPPLQETQRLWGARARPRKFPTWRRRSLLFLAFPFSQEEHR